MRIQPSRLSTVLQISSDMLRCEPAVAPGQFSSTSTQDTLHCDLIVRSLLCESRSSISTSPGRRGTISAGLHSDLNVERVVTAAWGPRNSSHSEYSVRGPTLPLRNSPDVRRLLRDNHRFRSIPTNTPRQNRGSHFRGGGPAGGGLAGSTFGARSGLGFTRRPECPTYVVKTFQ